MKENGGEEGIWRKGKHILVLGRYMAVYITSGYTMCNFRCVDIYVFVNDSL